MSDDRQQRELHLREQWEASQFIEAKIERMERDVKRGNALKRIIESERQEMKSEQTSNQGASRRIA